MKYLLIVSHGTFAPGLHSVINMLMGSRDDVLSYSMVDGMGAEEYTENLVRILEHLHLMTKLLSSVILLAALLLLTLLIFLLK